MRRLRRTCVTAVGLVAAAAVTGCQSNLRFAGPDVARIVGGFGPGEKVTFSSIDPCPAGPLGSSSVVAVSIWGPGDKWAVYSGPSSTNSNGSWSVQLEMPHNSGLPGALVWVAGDARVSAACTAVTPSNELVRTGVYVDRPLKVVK
jgi:hypothetical protein